MSAIPAIAKTSALRAARKSVAPRRQQRPRFELYESQYASFLRRTWLRLGVSAWLQQQTVLQALWILAAVGGGVSTSQTVQVSVRLCVSSLVTLTLRTLCLSLLHDRADGCNSVSRASTVPAGVDVGVDDSEAVFALSHPMRALSHPLRVTLVAAHVCGAVSAGSAVVEAVQGEATTGVFVEDSVVDVDMLGVRCVLALGGLVLGLCDALPGTFTQLRSVPKNRLRLHSFRGRVWYLVRRLPFFARGALLTSLLVTLVSTVLYSVLWRRRVTSLTLLLLQFVNPSVDEARAGGTQVSLSQVHTLSPLSSAWSLGVPLTLALCVLALARLLGESCAPVPLQLRLHGLGDRSSDRSSDRSGGTVSDRSDRRRRGLSNRRNATHVVRGPGRLHEVYGTQSRSVGATGRPQWPLLLRALCDDRALPRLLALRELAAALSEPSVRRAVFDPTQSCGDHFDSEAASLRADTLLKITLRCALAEIDAHVAELSQFALAATRRLGAPDSRCMRSLARDYIDELLVLQAPRAALQVGTEAPTVGGSNASSATTATRLSDRIIEGYTRRWQLVPSKSLSLPRSVLSLFQLPPQLAPAARALPSLLLLRNAPLLRAAAQVVTTLLTASLQDDSDGVVAREFFQRALESLLAAAVALEEFARTASSVNLELGESLDLLAELDVSLYVVVVTFQDYLDEFTFPSHLTDKLQRVRAFKRHSEHASSAPIY